MAFRGGQDPLPRPVALGGERELLVRQPILFRGAHALAAAGDVRTACPGALRLPGLGNVAAGSFFCRVVAITPPSMRIVAGSLSATRDQQRHSTTGIFGRSERVRRRESVWL